MRNRRPLGGFIKWLLAADQGRPLAHGMTAHAGAAARDAGIRLSDLRRYLPERDVRQLIDCVVEDIATRAMAGEKRFADVYLDGPGQAEDLADVDYLTAVRDSGMSLYQVERAQPGLGFIAQDLLFRGPALQVIDVPASRVLRAGQMVAARLIRLNGMTMMTPGHLPLSAAEGQRLLREMKGLLAAARSRFAGDEAPDDAVILRDYAAVYSNAWLGMTFAAQRAADAGYRATA